MVGPKRIATFREDLFDVPKGPLSKEVKFETPNSEEFVNALIKVYFDNPLENARFAVFLRHLFEYLAKTSSETGSTEGLQILSVLAEIKGLIDSIGVNLASLEGAEEKYAGRKDLVRSIRKTKTVPVIKRNK